jgi:hypothetical protein
VSVKISGLREVIQEFKRLPTVIDRETVYDEVSQTFAARLRAATPTGYSGQLRDSVIYEVSEATAEVGYEQEVETAGNPDLDSVVRPQTRGRSVLRWVSVDELSAVLEETFDAYAPEGVTVMSDRFAEQIDGGT